MATEPRSTEGTDLSRRTTGGGTPTRLSTETKHSSKTSELYAYVATILGILIAGNQIESEEGNNDYFAADKVWLYITILTLGYMISRGLAKSGSRDPYYRGGTNEERDR